MSGRGARWEIPQPEVLAGVKVSEQRAGDSPAPSTSAMQQLHPQAGPPQVQ